MTDLEMTKLCAEAMGCTETMNTVWDSSAKEPVPCILCRFNGRWENFEPLHDDAQAMALVKKCGLNIDWHSADKKWFVYVMEDRDAGDSFNEDLNRAIVECMARMQQAK